MKHIYMIALSLIVLASTWTSPIAAAQQVIVTLPNGETRTISIEMQVPDVQSFLAGEGWYSRTDTHEFSGTDGNGTPWRCVVGVDSTGSGSGFYTDVNGVGSATYTPRAGEDPERIDVSMTITKQFSFEFDIDVVAYVLEGECSLENALFTDKRLSSETLTEQLGETVIGGLYHELVTRAENILNGWVQEHGLFWADISYNY